MGKEYQNPDLIYLNEALKDINSVLSLIFYQIQRHVNYSSSAVFLYEQKEFHLLNYSNEFDHQTRQQLHLALLQCEADEILVRNLVPVRISDTEDYLPIRVIMDEWPDPDFGLELQKMRSWLALPLIQQNQLLGAISLGATLPDQFSKAQVALVIGLINETLKARGRLYARVQNRAVQEERLRMARELHDSVTQIFHAIQLETNTASTLLYADSPDPVGQRLAEIYRLAEGGLAELRALLFELRPESLAVKGLKAALQKQLDAFEQRFSLKVESRLKSEPAISLEAKEGLYRIIQEALQNVGKHAQATKVILSMEEVDTYILLEVSDDGRGFNPDFGFPGHLGLTNMRERAALLNAQLQIESYPGRGTRVRVAFPITY